MKFISLTENHLFSKAYARGQRAVTKSVAVYVLKDRHEKILKNANPMKTSINRKRSEAQWRETARKGS